MLREREREGVIGLANEERILVECDENDKSCVKIILPPLFYFFLTLLLDH